LMVGTIRRIVQRYDTLSPQDPNILDSLVLQPVSTARLCKTVKFPYLGVWSILQ
jgi:hypothetical protein